MSSETCLYRVTDEERARIQKSLLLEPPDITDRPGIYQPYVMELVTVTETEPMEAIAVGIIVLEYAELAIAS
jgi:hypothetical protein